ncbi:MAG: selenocysteine-specific translation elongation factor [Streptosporangiaceae bacterium]
MQVIATAGHVDHGKSTLVRVLTGMEPDRWAEERRRGLTIDLGFAWMTLPSGQQIAFVDVPGHERFVPNMLAGVGAVPAVLFTVAADEGWMPQSEEHLAAVHALGITHGLLAVTRSDLADPEDARRQALAKLAASSLGEVEAVAVSARTGLGLPELRDALDRLAARLPRPDPAAPVRLWVDRTFRIKGSGTVVTGTLPAGTIRTKQELLLTPSMEPVRVRGIETLKQPAGQVSGVARVALNLRAPERITPERGMALVEPGRWTLAAAADVRLAASGDRPPRELTVHAGSARTTARLRPLGGLIARLTLDQPLPLHVGDRLLLRDPGSAAAAFAQLGTDPAAVLPGAVLPGAVLPRAGPARPSWPPLVGATVLDVAPPAFRRRGAAAAAGRELAAWPAVPAAADLLRRHGLLRAADLRAMGVTELPAPAGGDWLADPEHWAELGRRHRESSAAHAAREPLAPGLPLEAARAELGLPARQLVERLAVPPLAVRTGYVVLEHDGGSHGPALPDRVLTAVGLLRDDLAGQPFVAPEAARLRELGLDSRSLAAAARAGLLLRVADQIVLAPDADREAARILAGLPGPFTAAEARQVLHTTRRVAIPLLEYLDRRGLTRRLPDDRRTVT